MTGVLVKIGEKAWVDPNDVCQVALDGFGRSVLVWMRQGAIHTVFPDFGDDVNECLEKVATTVNEARKASK